MKRGTASRVFFGVDKTNEDFGGLLLLSQVTLGKKSGMFDEHKGLCIVDNVLLGKGIARVISVIIRGTSPLSLPDAIADSLSYVKAFGGTEQRNIPQPYTQVNYVTNTAQTAVDTGIMIDFSKNYEFEVECRAVSGSWYILQSRASASGNITGIHGATSGSTITLVVGNVTVCTSAITRTVGNKLYVKATLNAGTATLYVKDETANTEDTQTGSYGTSQPNPTASVYLLGNAGGQYVDVNSDIYMARIKENDTVVMDYVPARQVATAGFYDKASGTFKTALEPANLSADGNTVPTPDAPMDIVSNNGVLKYSVNMANVNEQTALIGYYISTSGAVMTSPLNWIYQDYIPVEPNTTYTLTMSSPVYFVSISEYSTADDSGFVVRKAGSTGTNSSLTITTRSATKYLRFGVNIDNNNVTLDKVFSINWMLNKGNSLPYAPYSPTGIYTDGTVETLWMHGKNLFDKDGVTIETGKAIGADGSISNISAVNLCASYIPVSPNTTYTFSGNILGTSTTFFRVAQYKADQTFISRSEDSTGERSSYTFTTGADTHYIRFHYVATADISTYQLEQGSTATTYEPYYDGGTATAEMLLKVGDYQDVQSILDGAITRNIGIKVLDGTESWNASSTYPGSCYISNFLIPAAEQFPLFYCSHFEIARSTASYARGKCLITGNAAGWRELDVWYSNNGATAVADLKSWLAAQYAAGTPVIVLYPLATPTTESVAGQTLQVAQGDNTLEITQASLDNLELEAQYQAAVSLTIQEVQDANLDPNVEVTIN